MRSMAGGEMGRNVTWRKGEGTRGTISRLRLRDGGCEELTRPRSLLEKKTSERERDKTAGVFRTFDCRLLVSKVLKIWRFERVAEG